MHPCILHFSWHGQLLFLYIKVGRSMLLRMIVFAFFDTPYKRLRIKRYLSANACTSSNASIHFFLLYKVPVSQELFHSILAVTHNYLDRLCISFPICLTLVENQLQHVFMWKYTLFYIPTSKLHQKEILFTFIPKYIGHSREYHTAPTPCWVNEPFTKHFTYKALLPPDITLWH